MKIATSYHPADVTPQDRARQDASSRVWVAQQASALGANLTPDDVESQGDDHETCHFADVQVIPDEAVEAAAREMYASQTGGDNLDTSYNRPVWLNIARRALEAAYPATRADQLRRFANELEDALETGDSPHQLPYDWRDDAKLLEGDR